jgi:GAF domain-containing protein
VPSEIDWSDDLRMFAGGQAADLGPLAAEFLRLSEELLKATTVHGVLERVVTAARSAVPGADLVSVTLRTDDGYTTPVYTDELALKLDKVQYELGEGPCVESTRTPGLGLTFSGDLAAGAEFPRFGPAAAGLGARSVMAVGLFPQGDVPRLGALNLYAFDVNGLDEVDRDLALILAAHASTALAGTLASTSAELEATQLRQALQSRDVIGQAKGILMERRGISADDAFNVLRKASQSLNIKLATVAQTLVDRRAEI